MADSLLTSLENEITRLARKVVKTDIATLRSNSATHRRHIAELRRRFESIEREVKLLRRGANSPASAATPKSEEGSLIRFQACGLKKHRGTSGSAADYGRLVGVSPWSIL